MSEPKPPIEINDSHGRPRVELRRPSDGGVPPLPRAAAAAPLNDPTTGRFVDGKRAALQSARARRLREQREGVATLNPARCEAWLQPFVTDGGEYAMELLERFPDPALRRLVGATADAHTMFRGMLQLAASGGAQAGEARAWLREHRACLRELCALAGVVGKQAEQDDSHLYIDVPDGGAK